MERNCCPHLCCYRKSKSASALLRNLVDASSTFLGPPKVARSDCRFESGRHINSTARRGLVVSRDLRYTYYEVLHTSVLLKEISTRDIRHTLPTPVATNKLARFLGLGRVGRPVGRVGTMIAMDPFVKAGVRNY